MTEQHISIDGGWDVTVFYDVWPSDLAEVARYIRRRFGAPLDYIERAVENLRGWNAGYTLTSYGWRESVVCIGRATSMREFLNTVDHEIDHIQSHVAKYYDVELGTEQAAYLQGYIGGRLFEFVMKNYII